MHIDNDPKLDFKDVLIRPKRSTLTSRKSVDLNKTYKFCNSKKTWTGVPIVAANMDHCGTFNMATALGEYDLMVALHKHYHEKELSEFFAENDDHWYSIGMTESDIGKFERTCAMLPEHKQPKYVCIDVANGYSEKFVDFVRQFRKENRDVTIMAGNVVTAEMVEALILAGADIVKVGIGPGSVCTTRKVAGVGYPQLSAVIECADAAHGMGGLVCADGGCTTPGDIAKAFGAGADFVMLGGMLAGHDECDGERIFNYEGVICEPHSPTHMKFYGMSSKVAMETHNGGVADYRASEGKEVLVPYRGEVNNTIKEILGGVRSACTYTGSKSLKELPKRTTFIMVNRTHNTVYGE